MNLRNNRGVLGIDISVAFVIILIMIPIITGMIYNINKTNANIKRKSQALNIAINCMEIFKSQQNEMKDVTQESIEELIKNSKKINMNGNYVVTKDSIQYKIELNLTDAESGINNVSTKTLNVKVKYRTGHKEQAVELKTSINYSTE